ncbi:MAG: hypothetical protein VB875_13435 [Pirellulales bacterium]
MNFLPKVQPNCRAIFSGCCSRHATLSGKQKQPPIICIALIVATVFLLGAVL